MVVVLVCLNIMCMCCLVIKTNVLDVVIVWRSTIGYIHPIFMAFCVYLDNFQHYFNIGIDHSGSVTFISSTQ